MGVLTEEMEGLTQEYVYPISPELMERIHHAPEELSREELAVVFSNFCAMPLCASGKIIAECFMRLLPLLKRDCQ